MNDRHLDPPEPPSLPDWTEALLEVLEDHLIPDEVSKAINLAIDAHFEQEAKAEADALAQIHAQESYEVEDFEPDPVLSKTCKHGNDPSNCDHCDYEGDIECDAMRERRFR